MQLANRFGILAHAGLGVASAAPSSIDENENTAIFTLGLTPQVKVSNRVAVFVDATYLESASQQYYFNGQLINSAFNSRTAAIATFSIGASISLGKNGFRKPINQINIINTKPQKNPNFAVYFYPHTSLTTPLCPLRS